jgi:23S rRNA pseudouridine2605 synthase
VATQVRLDRALSKLGLASRADAQRMIRDGLVTVSGRIVTNPAQLVQPNPGAITIAGRATRTPQWRTIAFHKPRGLVTTRRDPEGRRTVFDALGTDADGLVPVGRLDMASTASLY